MTHRFWFKIVMFVLAMSTLLIAQQTNAQPQVVRIGVVVDGPWEGNEYVRGLSQQEIGDLLRGEFDVRFPDDKYIIADWTIQGVKSAIDRLLADPDIDLLITWGVIGSNDVTHRDGLSKPVIAPVVIDPVVQALPKTGDGSSGILNLNYVALPDPFVRDLKIFQQIVPFKKITILLNQRFVDAIPDILANTRIALEEINAVPEIIAIDETVDEFLDKLPGEVEAVYVAPLIHLPDGEFDKLVLGLKEHKLPSFSLFGRNEVERGLMASASDDFLPRLTRRVALNVQQILLGKDPGSIPAAFSSGERLTINMATVRAIDIWPSWAIMNEAELLNEQQEEIQRRLTLKSVVLEAVQANLDLTAKNYFVDAGTHTVKQARSNLLPQLDISGTALLIDDDRAAASFGSQAEKTVTGSAVVSQLIYSEQAWANYSIQRHIQKTREQDRRELQLDIAKGAGTVYLDVLRTGTFERIQRENLERSRTNLELARVRESVGYSGRSEVFRWESEIASRQNSLITANSVRNLAEIALNRILHRPLEEPFETEETGLDTESLEFLRQSILPYFANKISFRTFRGFMVEEGLRNSPELHKLHALVKVQGRLLGSATRAFWQPTVGLQASLSNILSKSGVGTESALAGFPEIPGIGSISFPQVDDTNWSIGITASFPLFTSGEKLATKNKAELELRQLEIESQAVRERIEQRVRSALHRAGASYAAIKQADAAADAANKSLSLVTDSYSQGVVSIIELIDAQNAALTANLAAANAVYNFLIDYFEVERSVGELGFLMTEEEQEGFNQRLNTYFVKAGLKPVRQ
jgi:outer membrane protein TolC